VTREADIAQLVGQTVEAFGRLDILVNDAGVEQKHTSLETPLSV
jgi:NAD(P)-dependent dehydrogenase (short-subunit alcohol dehydrogenase family)